jgi:hypothetical protein
MNEKKQGILERFIGVLYKPRQTFITIVESDLNKAVLVIVLMIILAGYSEMVYTSKIPYSIIVSGLDNVDSGQIASSTGILIVIGIGVIVSVGWIISTLLIHILIKFTGGVGSLKRFFAMHCYVSVPNLLKQLLRVIDSSLLDSSTLTGYYLSNKGINNKLLKALLGTDLLNIWGLAYFALIVIAIEENYKTSRSKAVIIAILPSLIYLAFNYFIA